MQSICDETNFMWTPSQFYVNTLPILCEHPPNFMWTPSQFYVNTLPILCEHPPHSKISFMKKYFSIEVDVLRIAYELNNEENSTFRI